MRTLTALALTLLFVACKRNADVQPDEMRNEPFALTTKDVETAQSTVSVAYEKIFNATRNGYLGTGEAETSLDVGDIRPAVEAFIAANADYNLYFRLELRENRADLTLPDGSRKFRAGTVNGTLSLGSGLNVGGPTVDAKQNPYAWEKVNAELQKMLNQIISRRTASKVPLKLMLSVYDYRRFLNDPTRSEEFDGSITKPHAEGGSRVVYRGWNVELK